MARAPRVEVRNGIHHVVARGNERKPIFRDDIDRVRFLELLERLCERYRWRPLCYCLMDNHYHLLARTPDANLARGMRELNGVYAQSFNRRHGRDGHLFQGRYRAVLVQADQHLHATVRYIIRNPVRAGMTTQPAQWRWTSHNATIGRTPPGFVAVNDLLALLDRDRMRARRRYQTLVHAEKDPPGHPHPLIHGDNTYVTDQLARIPPSPEFPHRYLHPTPPPLEQLLATPDPAALYHAHQHGYSMRQLAARLDVSLTTIHRRIRDHERRPHEPT